MIFIFIVSQPPLSDSNSADYYIFYCRIRLGNEGII